MSTNDGRVPIELRVATLEKIMGAMVCMQEELSRLVARLAEACVESSEANEHLYKAMRDYIENDGEEWKQ